MACFHPVGEADAGPPPAGARRLGLQPAVTERSPPCLPRTCAQENITQYLRAARKFGVDEYEMFGTNDLYDAKDMRSVVTQLHALGRLVQEKCPDYDGPTLGHKVVKKTKIVFTKAQLAAAANAPSLLNGGAAALAGVIPGTIAAVTSDSRAPSTGKRAPKPTGAKGAEVAPSAVSAPDPTEGAAAVAADAAPSAEDANEVLPAGWEAMTTDDGRTYYFHAESEVTQWEAPE